MTKRILLSLALAAFAAGCGSDENGADLPGPTGTATPNPATKGTIDVNYGFSGVEAPSRVRLVLIDGAVAGETCTTLAYAPSTGILADRPSLPINGTVSFVQLAPGNKYLLAAFGEKPDGTRVAKACHDQVNVVAGSTTQVTLGLKNWVGDMNGVYTVTHNVNLGLPPQVIQALGVLQAACLILQQPELCTLVNDVTDVVTSMDVVSEWALVQQHDGTFTGNVRWVDVEGIPVGDIDLVTGVFQGEVPGSTQMTYKAFTSTVQFGNLTLFVVEDVLGYDLGAFGPAGAALVQALSSQYVSPMVFTGNGQLTDANHDGTNEKIQGALAGHLEVAGWEHDFSMDYLAIEQP